MARKIYQKNLENGLRGFQFHIPAEGEDGYNYYGYINSSGYSVIMRENISTEELDFVFGGYKLALWSSRASLENYGTWADLADQPASE